MKNRVIGLLLIFISLLAGTFIYFLTRTEGTVINFYLSQVNNGRLLSSMQGLVENTALPYWFIYSLPDALWMLAMSLSILLIWKYQIHSSSIACTIIAVCAGMSHEILQGAGIISGTFDGADLAFIFVAGILPITLVYFNARTYKFKMKSYKAI
jgi:hypothetical protein